MNLKFSPWYDLHETKDIQHRYAYAVSPRCTPLSVDRAEKHAVFRGVHGEYRTSLSSCECDDFSKHGEPCKHILRLAMELGLIHANYESDLSQVPFVGASDPGDSFLKKAIEFMESHPHGRGSVLELLARDQVNDVAADIIEEPFLVHEYAENRYILEDPEYYRSVPVKGIIEEVRLRKTFAVPQFTSDYQMRKWYREHILEIASVLEPDLQLLTFDDGSQKIVDLRMKRYILGEKLCICRGRVVQYWQIRMTEYKSKAKNQTVHELLMSHDAEYRSKNTSQPIYVRPSSSIPSESAPRSRLRDSSPSPASGSAKRVLSFFGIVMFSIFGISALLEESLWSILWFFLAILCGLYFTVDLFTGLD